MPTQPLLLVLQREGFDFVQDPARLSFSGYYRTHNHTQISSSVRASYISHITMAAIMQSAVSMRVTGARATTAPAKSQVRLTAGFAGKQVTASVSLRTNAARNQRLVVRAAEEAVAKKVEEEPKEFVPPVLDPNTPSPIFGGSTGGLLRKAQVRYYALRLIN